MADETKTTPGADGGGSADPLEELRARVADIATVIAAQPAPADPAARLAHTRVALFADVYAEEQRQAAELREAEERRQRFERTGRQLAAEGRAAAAAR